MSPEIQQFLNSNASAVFGLIGALGGGVLSFVASLLLKRREFSLQLRSKIIDRQITLNVMPNPRRPFSTGRYFRTLTGGYLFGRHLCLEKPKVAGTLTTLRLRFRSFKQPYQTPNSRTQSLKKACSRLLERAWCGLAGLRMFNISQSPVLSSRHNPAVDHVRFAFWTLRDEAAQRRLLLR
jgi:hypothetical protein